MEDHNQRLIGNKVRERDKRETYSSGGTLEHGHLARGGLPLLSGDNGLENLGGNVPQLLVLGTE